VRDSTGVITTRLIAEKNNPRAEAIWGVSVFSLMQITYGIGGPPDPENMCTEALLRESFAGLDVISLKSHASSITSNHMALRMAKAQARPRLRIQLKYHMVQFPPLPQ